MAKKSAYDSLKHYKQRLEASKRWRKDDGYDATWRRMTDMYKGLQYEDFRTEDRLSINIAFATADALRLYVDNKKQVDLFVLDAEAVPEGGMGVARQLKDEVFNCPPVLLITGREQDNWLAAWSKAEATVTHPIDPFNIAAKCAALLKSDSALAN